MRQFIYLFLVGFTLSILVGCGGDVNAPAEKKMEKSELVATNDLVVALATGPPYLEIHHIGSGDGDATLFIAVDSVGHKIDGSPIWDTCVILIDAQRTKGGKEVWRYVKDTISTRFPTRKEIDVVIVTHLHADHYQGMTVVLDSAKANGWVIGAAIDRQNAVYDHPLAPTHIGCYDSLDVEDPAAASFQKYKTALGKNNLLPTVAFVPGADIFAVRGFSSMSFICAVADGRTFLPDSETIISFLPKKTISGVTYYTPKNENDLSIGFFIEFQGFHYLTLGDLGGKSGGNYVDGETPTTKWLKAAAGSVDYHMCGLKASHHGSAHSSTKWFADTNNPTVTVFEASLRRYGTSPNPLPTEVAIKNLAGTGANELFYTFVPFNPGTPSSYWTRDQLNLYNDVIIKLKGRPGEGNISMELTQAQKSKSFVYNGIKTTKIVTCTKGHDW